MLRYKSRRRDTGVYAYETGKDFIKIQFRDRSVYLYTNESTGRAEISAMKKLAAAGKGLTTFINKFVREKYEAKII